MPLPWPKRGGAAGGKGAGFNTPCNSALASVALLAAVTLGPALLLAATTVAGRMSAGQSRSRLPSYPLITGDGFRAAASHVCDETGCELDWGVGLQELSLGGSAWANLNEHSAEQQRGVPAVATQAQSLAGASSSSAAGAPLAGAAVRPVPLVFVKVDMLEEALLQAMLQSSKDNGTARLLLIVHNGDKEVTLESAAALCSSPSITSSFAQNIHPCVQSMLPVVRGSGPLQAAAADGEEAEGSASDAAGSSRAEAGKLATEAVQQYNVERAAVLGPVQDLSFIGESCSAASAGLSPSLLQQTLQGFHKLHALPIGLENRQHEFGRLPALYTELPREQVLMWHMQRAGRLSSDLLGTLQLLQRMLHLVQYRVPKREDSDGRLDRLSKVLAGHGRTNSSTSFRFAALQALAWPALAAPATTTQHTSLLQLSAQLKQHCERAAKQWLQLQASRSSGQLQEAPADQSAPGQALLYAAFSTKTNPAERIGLARSLLQLPFANVKVTGPMVLEPGMEEQQQREEGRRRLRGGGSSAAAASASADAPFLADAVQWLDRVLAEPLSPAAEKAGLKAQALLLKRLLTSSVSSSSAPTASSITITNTTAAEHVFARDFLAAELSRLLLLWHASETVVTVSKEQAAPEHGHCLASSLQSGPLQLAVDATEAVKALVGARFTPDTAGQAWLLFSFRLLQWLPPGPETTGSQAAQAQRPIGRDKAAAAAAVPGSDNLPAFPQSSSPLPSSEWIPTPPLLSREYVQAVQAGLPPRSAYRALTNLRASLAHPFIASPRGNGYQCHRTWESLLLGSIPLVPLQGPAIGEYLQSRREDRLQMLQQLLEQQGTQRVLEQLPETGRGKQACSASSEAADILSSPIAELLLPQPLPLSVLPRHPMDQLLKGLPAALIAGEWQQSLQLEQLLGILLRVRWAFLLREGRQAGLAAEETVPASRRPAAAEPGAAASAASAGMNLQELAGCCCEPAGKKEEATPALLDPLLLSLSPEDLQASDWASLRCSSLDGGGRLWMQEWMRDIERAREGAGSGEGL